jgi:hypothetical protein
MAPNIKWKNPPTDMMNVCSIPADAQFGTLEMVAEALLLPLFFSSLMTSFIQLVVVNAC